MEAASQRLKPVALPASPSNLAARDVSIIVPTNGTGFQFVVGALASWLAIDPLEVIVVTIDDQVQLLNALIDKSLERVRGNKWPVVWSAQKVLSSSSSTTTSSCSHFSFDTS